MRLSDVARDLASLSKESFEDRYGTRFLVCAERSDAVAERVSRVQTRHADAPTPEGAGGRRSDGYLVLPIRKVRRTSFTTFITVGRTPNNDVVIPDAQVSGFHAVFREGEGSLLVQDGNSRNGTFVNGKPVPPQGQGEPVEVRPGAEVCFGPVRFVLLDEEGLRRFADGLDG